MPVLPRLVYRQTSAEEQIALALLLYLLPIEWVTVGVAEHISTDAKPPDEAHRERVPYKYCSWVILHRFVLLLYK